MDGRDLVGVRNQDRIVAAPHGNGGHVVAGTGYEVVETSEDAGTVEAEAYFFIQLAKSRFLRRLPGIDPPSRQCELTPMTPEMIGTTGENQRRVALVVR